MEQLKVLGACPLDCPDTCSWVVTVQDGKAVTLRGNPEHPFTRGALCVKVNRYLEHAAADDRVLHPLRRVGRKGEGRFERIGWDEALDEIAARLTEVVDRYGGEAIWPYYGMGTLGSLQGLAGLPGRRLWNVLGTSRHNPTVCSIAGATGLEYTIGTSSGIDPEDLVHSKLILLWGTNTLTTGHHMWKFVQAARAEGAYVVAIDPVRTRTADQADEHLAPIPGTDAALALGLLNVIVGLGAEDRDYLERHTVGWPAFRERIAEFPPARVAEITGLPEDRIVALGERIAHDGPTAIRATMGLQRHAGGGMALRTLACIPAVTGDWGRPGGGLSYATNRHWQLNKPALFRDDLLAQPVRTLAQTRLGEGLLELADPRVMALVVIAANPVASTPQQDKIRAGMAREDLFTVVLEHFLTDTADYADIVLPATMQTEHMDVNTAYGHLYLAWNEPAVAPPGECLPTTETFRRLARHMGLTEPSLYDSDEQLAEQLLDSDHPWLAGITLDRLRKEGWVRISGPRPFLPFANGFPTPSGKLELYSERMAADGLDPVPGYTPPLEVTDRELAQRYPFALISGASHYFVNTVFANNPELQRRAGAPRVLLNVEDAAAGDLADGDQVRVFNDRGSFDATVETSDRVRPGLVATTKGYWSKLTGGSNAAATVAERDTDMGGGPVFHDTRVAVTLLHRP